MANKTKMNQKYYNEMQLYFERTPLSPHQRDTIRDFCKDLDKEEKWNKEVVMAMNKKFWSYLQ